MAQLTVARADVENVRGTFPRDERAPRLRAGTDCGVELSLSEPASPGCRTARAADPASAAAPSLWVSAVVCAGAPQRRAANHKRVHRLYRDAGLSLRRKKRKHLMRQKAVFPSSNSNEEWALDFATDTLASHRHLRILSIVDVFTRECLALETDTSLGSVRVIRALEQIITIAECRKGFGQTTVPSLRVAASWPGAWTGESNWCTSGPVSL